MALSEFCKERTKMALILFFYLANLAFTEGQETARPPHIIFIYADDLGWNDVSFHGSPDIPTPNIDSLALSGILLNNYYGEYLCTPSRAALLSGKYPMRLGLQHFVIKAGEASGLPLDVVTLPQHLKRLGYDTHLVGKWHLGYQSKAYTPTYRGFDTFFGYYNSHIDYYDYTYQDYTGPETIKAYYGIDLHNGTDVVTNFRGQYATYAFVDQAKSIILNHDPSKPLYLQLSHLAVHAGNGNQMLQAPSEIISRFKHIKDINRRIQAAVVSALDDTIGTIIESLHQKGMLKNSIVVFASDNGASGTPEEGTVNSNFPLRGSKFTFWEGGIRLPALIWSPLLNLDQPRVSKQLMHVTDWLPTLYSAAGGNIDDLQTIDGHDMWESFKDDRPSPRNNLVHTLDPVYGASSFRIKDFKIVNGSTPRGFNDWKGSTRYEYVQKPPSMYNWVFKSGSVVRDILMDNGWWISEDPNQIYEKAVVECTKPPQTGTNTCNPKIQPCLFNITNDPCEYFDIAKESPDVVKLMMDMINSFVENSATPQSKPSDPAADPACHNFTFVPWQDPEYFSECNYASKDDLGKLSLFSFAVLVVELMMDMINSFVENSATPQSKPSDPASDPACHNFTFVSWQDPKYFSECNYAS